jgi:hypothetical protein
MPTSDPANIPFVVEQLIRLQPKSVLDVGVGFGKWGVLAREYVDVWANRCTPDEWELRVEGIEIHEPYRNAIWGAAYDIVHVGDARLLIDRLGRYDVAIFCDVIEHMSKEDGRVLLAKLAERCNHVIVTTPVAFWAAEHDPAARNPHERHVSFWEYQDFCSYSGFCAELGLTIGAVLSLPQEAPRMVLHRPLDHIGVRPLLRALARRVGAKLGGRLPPELPR